MRKTSLILILLVVSSLLFAQGVREESSANIIASTSWTASFADLGGIDDVPFIAPANLAHPPEYEITVSDVVTINKADYFIYAGYERMMESMGSAIGKDGTDMVQIHTDNSLENVAKQAKVLATLLGTEQESAKRVEAYTAAILSGKERVKQAGLDQVKVYCHAMQIYLANDLGLEVGGTFGPGPITAAQINEVARGGYAIIIDNVHNPIAGPLLEVSPSSKTVIWRNFPARGGRGALQEVVQQNIEAFLR